MLTMIETERPTAEVVTWRDSRPLYQLRLENLGKGDLQMEVWQLPSPSRPQITKPVRLAGLKGRNLALIEHRLARRLTKASISIAGLPPRESRSHPIEEELALGVGLIFRVLAPMRSREKMLACLEGIEGMGREESAYWLGMAMHRKKPQRVLAALRMLLTEA